MEYWWNVTPCRLCYIQRWLLVALLGICGIYLLIRSRVFVTGAIRSALVVLVCVSTYHWLVQLGFISDPCFLPKEVGTIADFRTMLQKPQGCSSIGFSLFGIPVSALNSIAGAMMILFPLFQNAASYLFKRDLLRREQQNYPKMAVEAQTVCRNIERNIDFMIEFLTYEGHRPLTQEGRCPVITLKNPEPDAKDYSMSIAQRCNQFREGARSVVDGCKFLISTFNNCEMPAILDIAKEIIQLLVPPNQPRPNYEIWSDRLARLLDDSSMDRAVRNIGRDCLTKGNAGLNELKSRLSSAAEKEIPALRKM